MNDILLWFDSFVQYKNIIKNAPNKISRYVEPFANSCDVLFAMINSGLDIKYYIISDSNEDIISFWNELRDHPYRLYYDYINLRDNLNSIDNSVERKEYWIDMLNDYNKYRDPSELLFLNRTSSGIFEYDDSGNFIAKYQPNKKGSPPNILKDLIFGWYEILSEKNVIFNNDKFTDVIGGRYDFMYVQPPYYQDINYDELLEYLKYVKCKWVLNSDVKIPKELYKQSKKDLYFNF